MIKRFESILSSIYQRLMELRTGVQAEEGVPVVGGESRRQPVPVLGVRRPGAVRQQAGDGGLQAQADHAADLVDAGRRQARASEGLAHDLGDRPLAVDQGPVEVEHDEAKIRHGALFHTGRPS
jgi:hypothetical protein